MRLSIEVSAGELLDRITILEIKLRRLPRSVHAAVGLELAKAQAIRARFIPMSRALGALVTSLRKVNRQLWDLEEELRVLEREQRFDDEFVRSARAIYLTNDRRAALKRRVDVLLGGDIGEHKSHVLPAV